MRTLITTAFSILIALCCADRALAKEWRGVTPLHSTRENVEHLLGAPSESSRHAFYYSFPDEIAVIHFQNASCEDQCGFGWNVPIGTVTSIGVIPKGNPRKAEFVLRDDFKVEDAGGGFLYYTKEHEGLSVETYKETITLIIYSPAENDASLRCSRKPGCIIHFFPTFDEYRSLSFEDEKARLDNYVIRMREILGRGAILVYGQNKKVRNRLIKRAERAKSYLTQRRGLEAQRLLIIDGGYKPRSITELHLYTIGGPVTRIYLFPENDPYGTPN